MVDGIPSIGKFIMVGNGQIGDQPINADPALPPNTMPENPSWTRRGWFTRKALGRMFRAAGAK